MGLTASSCGTNLLDDDLIDCDYTIAIARKP